MLLAALSTVCVVSAGDVDSAVQRLQPLAESVRVVALGGSLDGCEIAVLASGWAQGKSWQTAQPELPRLEAFVRAGGGLLVFQPNPFEHPKDTLTIELVGAPVTFENWYRSGEPVRAVREHALTTGHDGGLPWPADRITTFDAKWTSLVRGKMSEDVSLLAGEFDCGRAVVDTDNPSLHARSDGATGGQSHHSDAFLRGVLDWLTVTRSGCAPES